MLKQNRETLLYFHTSLYMQTATLSHENYCCAMVPHGPCSPQVISIQIQLFLQKNQETSRYSHVHNMQLTNDNALQNSEKQSTDSSFPVLTKKSLRSSMLANSSSVPRRIGLVSFLGYRKLQDNIRQRHSMMCLNLWFINLCLSYYFHPAHSVSQSKTVQQSVSVYLQADSHSLLLNKTAFSWNNTAHCVTLSPPHSSSPFRMPPPARPLVPFPVCEVFSTSTF